MEPTEPEGPRWGETDHFLGLRDERPVLDGHLAELRTTYAREREEVAKRLHSTVDQIEARLGLAKDALSNVHKTLAGTLEEWKKGDAPDPRSRRRIAAELEGRLTALYRQVRLGPGRALDGISTRRTLLQLLTDMRARYAPAVEAFPESASIIKARRRHPEIPDGGRVCDVHEDAVRAAGAPTRWPLVGPARRFTTRIRLWSAYEVLDVPARDIARTHVLVPTVLRPDALADEYAEVHQKAKTELEESWRIVRSNLDVAVHELLDGEPAGPPDGDDAPHDPVKEIAEIVLGALERAREKIDTIAEPQRAMAASVVEKIEEEQARTLEQLQHDLEKSEKLSVRLRWLGRRLARRRASWTTAITRAFRSQWLRVRRVARRGFFRAEDATLRIGRAIGIGQHAEETLLAFADLPNAEQVEERARALPPIYRRLFALTPLRTREMLVGREESLATLGTVLQRWRDGRPASVAVVGPEGSGKTTLLNCFEADLADDIEVSRHGFEERVPSAEGMLATVSSWFDLDPLPADFQELAARLLEMPPRVVIVEGGHHLLLRTVGAIRLPEAFFSVVLATRAHFLWIVTMRQFPWRRMDELLRVSQYFTHTVEAPFPSSVQLREAILLRHGSSGLHVRFSEESVTDRRIRKLLLSHPADSQVVQDSLRDRYFENLFAASGGNITSALFYWLASVSTEPGGERLVVQTLNRPDASFLSRFDRLYLFTLAELLNHGTLTPTEHAAIFRTRESRSRAVLTYLHQLQLIKPVGNGGEQYCVNPVFWHLVSSTLESMRILY